MSDPAHAPGPRPNSTEHRLRDGRVLVLREGADGETVELRAPSGDVELSIALGADGPVVKVLGARLELEAADTLSMKARVVELQAAELARVHSDGQLVLTSGLDTRMVADGEVHVLGKMIWLN